MSSIPPIPAGSATPVAQKGSPDSRIIAAALEVVAANGIQTTTQPMPACSWVFGRDVMVIILRFLTGEKIAECHLVCKGWNEWLLNDPILRKKENVARAKSSAQLIGDPKYRAQELVAVVKVEVGIDREQENATLKQAKVTAQLIGDPRDRAQALVEVVKVEVGIDRERALATLQEAKEAARLMGDPMDRAQALVAVVKVEVGIDRERALATLQKAKEAARLIENLKKRAQWLVAVVKVEVSIDLEQAKVT
ncbi:hypothetical protein ACFLR2_00770, partial [Chlamydiota bacterium]